MQILVATLCDFAQEYPNGKLCLMGTFDTIGAHQMPVQHPFCWFAVRIAFQPGDEGTHSMSIHIIDADGKPLAKEPITTPQFEIQLPNDGYFLTKNFVAGFQNLRFSQPGMYSIDVEIDGEILGRVPLRIALIQQSPNPAV